MIEIRHITALSRRHIRQVIVYTVLSLLSAVFALLSSLIYRSVVDYVTGASTQRSLIRLTSAGQAVALGVGFMIFMLLFRALSGRVSAKIRLRVGAELTASLFDSFIRSDYQQTQRFPTGDVLNRFNADVSTVADAVLGTVPDIISAAFRFGAALVIILYHDSTMALLALVTIPVSVLISRFLLHRMHKYAKEMKKAGAAVAAFNTDAVNHILDLKSFGLVTRFSVKLRELQREYIRIGLDYNKLSIIATTLLSFAAQAVSYLCFGWGVYIMWQHKITFGTLVMFLQLTAYLSSSFSSLVGIVPTIINASAASQRIYELSGLEKESDDREASRASSLDAFRHTRLTLNAEAVTFRYDGSAEPVLREASFTARSGDVVAVTGPSGAGKTTLLYLFLALLRPQSGFITVENSDTAVPVSPETRPLISYVPQKNVLFSATLRENMTMIRPDATEEQIRASLEKACAWDFVAKLPGGLDCAVGAGGHGFSEGQLQRLSIARALLRDAPVLLLDEATSALDPETEAQILENLRGAASDKICVITSHRASVFTVANKAYEVSDGTCRRTK